MKLWSIPKHIKDCKEILYIVSTRKIYTENMNINREHMAALHIQNVNRISHEVYIFDCLLVHNI